MNQLSRLIALLMLVLFGGVLSGWTQETHRQQLRDKFQHDLEAIARGYDGVTGFHIVDLTDGSRFAVSDTLIFPQASAIKIPILLELFRRADIEPALLRKRVDVLQHELIILSSYEFHGHYLGVAVSLTEIFVSDRFSNQCRNARLSNHG